MDKTVKEKMIKEILNSFEYWDKDDLVECLQDIMKDTLPQEPDEVIQEMYNDIGGESIN